MKTYFGIGLTLFTLLLGQLVWANETINISTPWIREAPPNTTVLAAYMIINNSSKQQKVLTAVASPTFKKVEIHQTVIHDGMMHMKHLPQLIIAPKGQITLEPGGYHLMLMGYAEHKRPVRTGDKVELTLKFTDGEEIIVTTPVQKSPPLMEDEK